MQSLTPPAPFPGALPTPVPPPPAPGLGDGARLWLVRHAEVEKRYHDVAYGALDVQLSAEGLVSTARMGRAFGKVDVSLVLASDLERAWKLGKAIAEASGAPIRSEVALREIDRGEWQGRPRSEFIENWRAQSELYWSDPYRWRTPGGEGDEMVFTRAWPKIAEGLERVDGGTLVVAAHGQLIRVLLGRALNLTVPESYDYCLGPAHATLLVDEEKSWRIAARNVGPDGIAPDGTE